MIHKHTLLEALSKSYSTLLHSAAHTHACTHNNAHIQTMAHSLTHTNKCAYNLENTQTSTLTGKHNSLKTFVENLTCFFFFFCNLLFSGTMWGLEREKSAAEVQVIFIFIQQGSSFSLQTQLHEDI